MNTLTLGTGTNYRFFNTWRNIGSSPDGTPITLASGALRARVNGGAYVNAGLTLSVDHTDGSSGVTGQHRVAIDVDNGTLALAAGDTLSVVLSAGTVNSVSQAGAVLWTFLILPTGLTTAEKADVATAATGTAMTEAYPSDGGTMTMAQFAYLLLAHHQEKTVSSTTVTLKKVDGSTTAATLTLNSATTPTSVTRSG